jgi:hypothetical protein
MRLAELVGYEFEMVQVSMGSTHPKDGGTRLNQKEGGSNNGSDGI